jgi:energy-coupling factor transporter transmembrane protein EcfT
MLEWLAADPLNGIIITITFFISVIIGRQLRMKKDAQNMRKLMDPRIKILFLFFLIISITLMRHWYIPIGILVICILISLKLKIFRTFGRKLVFPALLAFFIIVIDGFESGFLIFSRVVAASSLTILLLSTASENEILKTMCWYRVPVTMLDISSLMSRYIKAFSLEARKMKMAQISRCGLSGGYRKKMHDIASIIGALITRALLRAELVYRAMVSRGWKQDHFSLAGNQPLNVVDLLMGFVLSTGIIILIGIDRVI